MSSAARSSGRHGLVAAAFGMVLVGYGMLQFTDAENARAKRELWEWAGQPMGQALKRTFGARRPLLAVDAAGALPYWSGLPSLDMLRLNDAYIPRHPPPGFGRGGIGHELGDPDYVWRHRPDLIAFCGAVGHRGPCVVGGGGLFARPDFREHYQAMHVQVERGGPVGHLYVRRDGKAGIERDRQGVRVPAYLLTDGAVLARPGPDGRLAVEVGPNAPAQIEHLPLSAGTYRVQTTPPLSRIGLACEGVT